MPRVHGALGRLERAIWHKVSDVECAFGGSVPRSQVWEEARAAKFRQVKLPFSWGRLYDEAWFELKVTAWPSDGWLCWRDDGEGTLYADGLPYYGFDVAHRFCKLPPKRVRLAMHSLCLQSAIWHPSATGLGREGSRLTEAAVYRRDEAVWTIYHDLLCLAEIANEQMKTSGLVPTPEAGHGAGWHPPILQAPVLLRRILRGLEEAVDALDLHGVEAARQETAKLFAWLRGQNERLKAVLTGHAHIDLVWLWPERVTGYKGTHTFATMNRLMGEYPEFRFASTQPALHEAVEQLSPELMKEVGKRMRAGQWETTGATHVESDTQVPCGEALARSFLLGQKSFIKTNGRPARVLWLPDVFGYSACIPQIMRQTGVDSFFTTKLTWSNINRFPYSSFLWRGPDGSEVLGHITQETGYNQRVTAAELRKGGFAHAQSDIHDEFLAPTGYGDGGGGVTEEMLERARRFRGVGGLPEVEWGHPEEFFQRLGKVRDRLPVWQGELYLEYHRGTLTTHSELKLKFREAERALQTWEAVRCATRGKAVPDEVWKRMVFAQFHDYIPGSSVWEVYEEGLPELERLAANALHSAVGDLSSGRSKKKAVGLFNPLPLPRLLILEGGRTAVELPPLAGAPVSELKKPEATAPARCGKNFLRSAQVEADFTREGLISRLAFGGVEVPVRGALAYPVIHPDSPHNFEAWEIDRSAFSLERKFGGFDDARCSGDKSLQASVSFRGRLGKSSRATVTYTVDAFRRLLLIDYDVDWREQYALLRLLFPTAYAGREARFGTPFGSVLRGQQPGDARAEAMFEAAGSRWMSVTDDSGEGLSILTEAKYGFSCRDGVAGVSLLRGAVVTSEDPAFERSSPATLRRGGKREKFTDQGRHRIRLALAPSMAAGSRAETAAALAETVFGDLLEYEGSSVSSGFLGLEGGESLVPCWAKPAEDGRGWILRLHEVLGRRGESRLCLAPGFTAQSTDLSESKNETAVEKLVFSPNQILSVRILPPKSPRQLVN